MISIARLANPKIGLPTALLAGAIAPLSLSPFNLWPLAILSAALFLLSLQTISSKQALLRGWSFGMGLFGVGASWVYVSIHDYGYASVPLAALLTLLFVATLAFLLCATFAWSYVRLIPSHPSAQLLGFPALWVLFEWTRSWLLTGFPWLFLGYSHTDTLLSSWAPVTGVYGLSFYVVLTAALSLYIAQAFYCGAKKRYGLILVVIIPWLVALPLDRINWVTALAEPLKVLLVQPNVTQDIKWLPEQRPKTLSLLQSATLSQLDNDLIVWPENAVPALYQQAGGFLNSIDTQARITDTAVITGIPFQHNQAGETSFHNSIVALGAGSGVYHKQKLVPFGEYVPLQSLLRGVISFFDLPMSNFKPGAPNQAPLKVQLLNQKVSIAPYICYEIVYPDFARKLAAQSQLMLTISDDSWFGNSMGPYQHLQMAQMRAQENARALIRATNTGFSASIDHKGNVLAYSDRFQSNTLATTATLHSGVTPFGRWGSWPVLILCTIMLIIARLKYAGRNPRN